MFNYFYRIKIFISGKYRQENCFEKLYNYNLYFQIEYIISNQRI